MCEYCERRKRIETEIDNEGYMLVYDPDPEYHIEDFALDVYDSEGELRMAFSVPCCPMCGRDLRGERS